MSPLLPIPPEEPSTATPMPFDALWPEVKPKLYGVLARYGIPPEDAEDLIQTVIVQYWEKRHIVREPLKWIPAALHNICKMHWRTRGRSRVIFVDQPLLEVLAEEETPEQESKVARRELSTLISRLKERCRKILKMRYLGYDRHEIAGETGYKLSGIDKVSKRCIDELSHKFRVAASGLGRKRETGGLKD